MKTKILKYAALYPNTINMLNELAMPIFVAGVLLVSFVR
jgi:hypothetical protein